MPGVGAGWESTAGALGNVLRHALAEPQRWPRIAHDEHSVAGAAATGGQMSARPQRLTRNRATAAVVGGNVCVRRTQDSGDQAIVVS